jgi:hypothetical protein
MRRTAWIGTLLVLASQAIGCVERRFIINSQPQGALVYSSTGDYLGATPLDYYFVYYGKYQFTLVKPGHEPLTVVQDVAAPWYELPGIDFISENINPFKVRDVRTFCYTLQPAVAVPPDELLNQASQLRARGQALGAPRKPRPALTEPAPPAGPTPAPAGPPLGPPVQVMPGAVGATSNSGHETATGEWPFNAP